MALLQDPGTDPQVVADACGDDPSWACRQVLDWTDGNEFVARTVDFLLARPLQILIILVVAWVANRLLRRAITRFTTRVLPSDAVLARLGQDEAARRRAKARAETTSQVLRSVAAAVVYTIAGFMVLGQLGINLGPLLAGAGIAGIAIGFGAQSLVRDFLSGIFMLLEDQYGVGDVVDVGHTSGVVEAVTLRTTRIRDLEGTLWHVPNGEIVRVANHTQQWARAVLDVRVPYDADLEHATEVVVRTARALRGEEGPGGRILAEPELWGVEDVGPDGVVLRLVVQTKPGAQWSVRRELWARLKAAFDAEGIGAAVPQQALWVREGRQPARPPAGSPRVQPVDEGSGAGDGAS